MQLVSQRKSITGFRFNLIYGKNKSITGLDIAACNHTTTRSSLALQIGLVGYAEGDFSGWQSNLANWTSGNYKGLQWGAFNYSNNLTELQIGFVNYAVSINKGVQIGLINFIKTGGAFPFFPLINWSF